MIQYNLQFFAQDGPGGEKTEPATAKKLEDARKEGKVGKSKEVSNALSLIAVFLTLKIFIGWLGTSLMGMFQVIYGRIPEAVKTDNGNMKFLTINLLLRNSMIRIIIYLAPFLLVGVAVAIVANLLQFSWKVSFKPMEPKLSKFNPISGLKRIISLNSLLELGKSLIKLGIICYVVYSTLKDQIGIIYMLYDVPLLTAIQTIGTMVIDMGLKIALYFIVLAAADFLYQKWKFAEDMKMTKQEVKDEYKNIEGNPEIKSKQKQRMREASQRRMMQSVPEADVVITNPTHYAVAILYDGEKYPAPIVVAKGEDYLAQKIKEKAKESGVEIVENKPLARMLYANVEIGEQVPPELYHAVADVLAYVYQLQGRTV